MKPAFVLSLTLAALLAAGEMALIPAGTFTMGGKGEDATPHEVRLSAFWMDKCEVTQEEFRSLLGENPSRFQGDRLPVERTRWKDCIRFCNLRSQKEGLKPCYDLETGKCDFSANGYRLPTEAEWEYACRAGQKGDFFFRGGKAKLAEYAWFRKNSQETTHPVGMKKPNGFGLFDMYGNVAEWCQDFYDAGAYASSEKENPRGPAGGTKKVLRGGSWQDRDSRIASGIRQADDPATADICQGYDTYGFRCVRNAE